MEASRAQVEHYGSPTIPLPSSAPADGLLNGASQAEIRAGAMKHRHESTGYRHSNSLRSSGMIAIADTVETNPLLTREEEIELAKGIEAGSTRAKDQFFKANLRLVLDYASRYQGFAGAHSFADLFQEGVGGLMQAIDRYDYRTGQTFGNFSSMHIRGAMTRAIANTGRMIRLPTNLSESLPAIDKSEAELERKLGRPPTNQEISDATEKPLAEVIYIRDADRRTRTGSLNRVVPNLDGQPTELEVIDTLADSNVDVEEEATTSVAQEQLPELYGWACWQAGLTGLERKMLRLKVVEEKSYVEMSEITGLSKDRCSKLAESAQAKFNIYQGKHRQGLIDAV